MSKVKLGDVAEEVKETYDGKGNPAIVGLEHLVPGDIRLKSWRTHLRKPSIKDRCYSDVVEPT